MSYLDARVEKGDIFVEEVGYRRKASSDLWSLLRTKDFNLFQRSRFKFLKEGDANIGLFHACIKNMNIRNPILTLTIGEYWVEGVAEIRQEVVN